MTITTLITKALHNATRTFDNYLGAWQAKAVKKLIFGITKNETTILQQLCGKDEAVRASKYREGLSNHLGKIDLKPIVQDKAKKLISKSNKYKERNILAGDASDIFKPHAQCMEALNKVRDGSTGNFGNGYVVYGININGITQQLEIKDPSVEYIGNEKREIMLKNASQVVKPKETIAVFDRGHDDAGFIDILTEQEYNFVVRAKKNRIVKNIANGEGKKIEDFGIGRYRIEIEGGTTCYLYVLQGKGKEPIRLYSNISFDEDKECLEIYLKRRKIEEDYKKMKSFGLEKVRLMSLKKVTNIMLIIQLIIMIGQDLYNEVMKRTQGIAYKLFLHYKRFCKKRSLTPNHMSFLRFISENITNITFRFFAGIPKNTLFGGIKEMKKVGLI